MPDNTKQKNITPQKKEEVNKEKITKEQKAEISRKNGKNGGRPTAEEMERKRREAINKLIGEKLTKMTPEVVKKLEEVFAVGGTVTMACYYANISRETYYKWIKKNPELSDRFDDLREKIPLAAVQNIAHGVLNQKDIPLSERVLSRYSPKDYADTINLRDGNKDEAEDESIIKEYRDKLKQNLKKRSQERAKEDGELNG